MLKENLNKLNNNLFVLRENINWIFVLSLYGGCGKHC